MELTYNSTSAIILSSWKAEARNHAEFWKTAERAKAQGRN